MNVFDALQGLADAALGWDVQCVAVAPPAWWQQRQELRLRRLLSVARERAPRYAGLPAPGEQALQSLAHWPVTHKQALMDRFESGLTDRSLRRSAVQAFVRDPRRIGQCLPGGIAAWESSGSSGVPGLFVHDAQALRVYDALEALRRPQRWLGNGRLAFVGATQGHYASVCTIERQRWQYPWLAAQLRVFSFLQPMPALVAELQRFDPRVLAAYPSTALVLAEEAAAGRLALELDSIWTGGETLTPAVRAAVEQAFAAPVVNSYGASECLTIAGACDAGALHLNADWVIVEPVDERHRPVPAGTFGATALITNLANHLQPLIRYDIGDRVRLLPQRCSCGSPLPAIEVEGRTDDSLLLRGAGGRAVRLPPLAMVSVLEEAGVFDFQLAQRSDHALCLTLAHGGADGARELRRARQALQCYLRTQGVGDTRLECHCGRPCRHGASGKTQRVIAAAVAA
ncbi:MAG: phenylacetate--CoA ligase family protein [Burkholderiaceae bacterium]